METLNYLIDNAGYLAAPVALVAVVRAKDPLAQLLHAGGDADIPHGRGKCVCADGLHTASQLDGVQ